MITWWAILLRIIGATIVAFAALFMKIGSRFRFYRDLRLVTKNYILIFGLFLYAVSSILSIIAYRGGDLSLLLPINSLSYVGSMILAVWVLKEKMNVWKYLGMTLIILGVIIIVQ